MGRKGDSSAAGYKSWFLDNNSCGDEILAAIDGVSFQGVEATATGCGFYLQDREHIKWTNSAERGVGWELAIARKLLEFGLVQVTAGDTMQLHVGFNLFDSY